MALQFDETRFIEALTRHQPAREVLQATCVKLWQKAVEWNPDTPFLPWAFTVARFVALSHVRDRMRDRLVLDEDVVLAMADETEDAAEAFSERREALELCLRRVKAEQREMLRAHYIEGRSVRDIAQSTGRGESAIKMTLLRVRQLLSDCIETRLRTAS
jgi:RNA polymerase sigma-70 factor (ECF subfamily)